jgi:hypothetical protein
MRASHQLLRTCALLAFPMVVSIAGAAQSLVTATGDAKVTPGEFVIEHPTLVNLGFEWHVDGDANRNASVNVSFRKQGDTAWQAAMPLARLQRLLRRRRHRARRIDAVDGGIAGRVPL